MNTGQLDVLNCGEGHMEIRFDETDTVETERAKRVIKDMLARGYSLFIHDAENKLTPVKRFDETKGCYIIADSAEVPATPMKKKAKEKSVPMHEAKAVSIGRSAGG